MSSVIVFGIFLIFFFSIKKEEEVLGIYIIIALLTLIFFFFDTISLFKHEYYKPKKINKILNSSPFLNFYQKGFKKEDEKLVGQVRNYNVYLGIQWENYKKRPDYYFKIIYNPMSYGRLLRQDEHVKYNKLLADENMLFYLDSIYKIYHKKIFSKISYNSVFHDMNTAIDFLKSRKLETISFKEWEDYLPKVEEQEETFAY